MKYKYDNLQFSSLLPNYINIDIPNFSINCSGTILNGHTATFTGSITLTGNANLYRLRALNTNTNVATNLISSSDITNIWQFTSTESVTTIFPMSGNTINMNIDVFNGTGGSITLTPQTYRFDIIEYQLAV